MSKKKKVKRQGKIPLIIIGLFLTLGGLAFIAPGLFGNTGYITEITRSERILGSEDIIGAPNSYRWHVNYKFRTATGEIATGFVEVRGDAISSKSGLHVGSPVRYFAFYPSWNQPGSAGIDIHFGGVVFLAVGVFMLTLAVKKPKPKKTPAQRSRAYQAAKNKPRIPVPKKPADLRDPQPVTPEPQQPVTISGGNTMFCESCITQINADAKFCRTCGASVTAGTSVDAGAKPAPAAEPDWDSFEYDDTPFTTEEYNQLDELLTSEEWEDEFELTNIPVAELEDMI